MNMYELTEIIKLNMKLICSADNTATDGCICSAFADRLFSNVWYGKKMKLSPLIIHIIANYIFTVSMLCVSSLI